MRSSHASVACRATPAFFLVALLQLVSTDGSPYYAARRRWEARFASAGHIRHDIGVARHGAAGFPSVRGLTSSRNLLQTAQAPRCAYDGGFCQLNAAYTTTLGPPRTDTQKLIAHINWLAGRQCGVATSREGCKQLYDRGHGCMWSTEHGGCTLMWTPSERWFRGNLFCPGSLADSAATCTAAYYDRSSPYNTTGTAPLRCTSRPGCVWLPGGDPAPPAAPEDGVPLSSAANNDLENGNSAGLTVSDVPVSLLVPSLLAPFYRRRWSDELADIKPPSFATGACVPQWVVEGRGNRSMELERRLDENELRRLLAGRTPNAAELYLPVYDELFGTCTGAQRAKLYLESADASCRSYDEADTCLERAACGWRDGTVEGSPSRPEGSCQAEASFVWELLYDPNDTWVKAINAAAQPCATAGTNASACASAGGTIPVDYAVLDSYGNVGPSWMAAGGRGVGSESSGGGGSREAGGARGGARARARGREGRAQGDGGPGDGGGGAAPLRVLWW